MNQTQAKHTPGPWFEEVWAGPYQPCKSKDGRAYLLNAVYSELPCGCQVIGNGTLPDPLSVKLCPKHSATDELLEACKALIAEQNDEWYCDLCDRHAPKHSGGPQDGKLTGEKLQHREGCPVISARSAIQKAEGQG